MILVLPWRESAESPTVSCDSSSVILLDEVDTVVWIVAVMELNYRPFDGVLLLGDP